MRQVDRALVTFPERLKAQNITNVNKAQLIDHKKISGDVYRHQDVKDSLKELYFEKCYICDCDVTGNFKVEHYLPKKHFPQLGYTWDNLHKSCEGCNLAKEDNGFLVKDIKGTVIDINLLDPSNSTYKIADYMRFNITATVELVQIGNDPLIINKAKNTIKYLNGEYKNEYSKTLKYLRSDKANNFLRYYMTNLFKHKELIFTLRKLGIANYIEPIDHIERDMHIDLCQGLINLDNIYLGEAAPFSTCTRVYMTDALRMTYPDLLALKEKMRITLGI
ncbi:conserved hypothetical protein [Photobacterium leiognathi lrivu.4.1]|uniref:HNH nuclease domain-containing protein n=1 Tax=Photobacterium leiognathi lrivu.4.1 TaxID=1248232 RepID=V5ENV3_PHOLE|nr:hypothetical protein [Photobacterium leiognathi]GAD31456.1 conserved hypothetical protein [Photobacterium leiognathi lrivu.4.1]